jgi:hypothetical protein
MKTRRRHWRTVLGVAAGLAAITATVALALTRNDSAGPALPLVPLASVGQLRTAPPAGPLLFIYSVEPGTPSHDAMRLLATWAATQDAEAAHPSTASVDDRASPTA